MQQTPADRLTKRAPVDTEVRRNAVAITGLHKSYGDVPAVRGLDLEIREGEFITLLGASGCGKTTTLRVLAGLEQATSGRVEFFGKPVVDTATGLSVPPNRRDIGMVFQSYALWPHMTALDNVLFPLRNRRSGRTAVERSAGGKATAKDYDRLAREALARVHCDHLAMRYPGEMSGGQQQRVALARAIVHSPPLVLLDEPLSNLDANLRKELRIELRRLQQDIGFTALYVTHDQAEALSMSDRIVLMREGRIEQIATPRRLFEFPATPYAAGFVGSHNVLPGRVIAVESGVVIVRTEVGVVRSRPARAELVARAGDAAIVAVRSDRLQLRPRQGGPAAEEAPATVVASEYSGSHVDTIASVGTGQEVIVRDYGGSVAPERGTPMWIGAVAEVVLTELGTGAEATA